MESRAIARYVRVTPRKVNQVLDLVRGSDVESALSTLTFSKKHVARQIGKTVRSAVANAVQADSKIDVEDLYIKEALVGPGPIMKRWLPRAQGRATPILKRSSHITIILGRKEKKKKVKPARTAAPKAPTGAEAKPVKAAGPKVPAGDRARPAKMSSRKSAPGKPQVSPAAKPGKAKAGKRGA
jgi:large subunit ribosomal protein L22